MRGLIKWKMRQWCRCLLFDSGDRVCRQRVSEGEKNPKEDSKRSFMRFKYFSFPLFFF